MTGYHFEIGYNGATHVDYDEMWEALKRNARKVADDPAAIIAEARRLGAPETCADGCCQLETYADNYAEPFESAGHPVVIIESDDPERRQVMQMASTDSGGMKYHVRRAYARLLIEAMHRDAIEINLTVA